MLFSPIGLASAFSLDESSFFIQPQRSKKGRMVFMDWIKDFDLFLFDFDGLLVDTESLHFEAYRQTCARLGLTLDWDMREYGKAAYFHASGLKEALCALFPKVLNEAFWPEFYAKKQRCFIELVQEVHLMPGVQELLARLKEAGKKRVVVTHSTRHMVDTVRRRLSALESIEHWLVREDYKNPKPAPDGYLLAIQKYGKPSDRVIGFEDSPKGLQALIAAGVQAVLINPLLERYQDALFARSFPELVIDPAQK